jgi:hypothetical protein
VFPELEILLSYRGKTAYNAMFRYRAPDSAVPTQDEAPGIRIDPAKFDADALLSQPKKYGLALGRALLFDHPVARNAFAKALRGLTRYSALRVRLSTDQQATERFRLRWELLRNPDSGDPNDPEKATALGFDNRFLFSRYLFSSDMRELRLRPRSSLSALIAIAAPADVGDYADAAGHPLPNIAVGVELAIAKAGLAGLSLGPPPLVSDPERTRVTLERLVQELQKEPDVLYLVCHGAMVEGEPKLLLEDDAGHAVPASGDDLIASFEPLRVLPRLVILVSCQGGGDTAAPRDTPGADRAVLGALGPRLATAGVPAVLAMQGDLDKATADKFLPAFFQKLNVSDGQVEEAVTAGRVAAAGCPDPWVPVLYTRLVEGRVWFTKGLAAQPDGAQVNWRMLVMDLYGKKCVPILGSGVLEPFVGSTRDLAKRLAEGRGYPLSLSSRDDLPQVTQFLQAMQAPSDPLVQVEVVNEMARAVAGRFPDPDFGRPEDAPDPGADLRERLGNAWEKYRTNRRFEPHQYLARMPGLTTFITTNPDDLMERALKAEKRLPRVYCYPWSEEEHNVEGPEDDSPRVFHLMGDLSDLHSLIVTEDEYFRFLTENARRSIEHKDNQTPGDLADGWLRRKLAASSLLFLGFRVTDWDF